MGIIIFLLAYVGQVRSFSYIGQKLWYIQYLIVSNISSLYIYVKKNHIQPTSYEFTEKEKYW